jgi:hypothetical protein
VLNAVNRPEEYNRPFSLFMRRFLKTHTELFCLKSQNKQSIIQNRANRGSSCSSVTIVTRICTVCPNFSPPHSIQTSSQAHPLTREPFLRSQKDRSMELTMHHLLTTRLRMSGDEPSLPLYLHGVYMNKIYLLFSMTTSVWGRNSHAVTALQSFLQLLQFLIHCTSHIASVTNG